MFGVLALVLPRFGYALRWFEALGTARLPVAVGLVLGGIALVVLAARRRARER